MNFYSAVSSGRYSRRVAPPPFLRHSRQIRCDRKSLTVTAYGERSVLVRSIDSDAVVSQRFHGRGRGMAEQVVAANADQSIFRMNRVDELRRGPVSRCVVPDLEHVGAESRATAKQPPCGFGAGVAGEEHAKVPVFEPKDDRVFVDVIARSNQERLARTVE